MSGAHSAATDPPAPKRKGEVKRKHTVGRVVLVSTLVLALVTALSVVFLYRHLNGNLNVEDVTDGPRRRPSGEDRARGRAQHPGHGLRQPRG